MEDEWWPDYDLDVSELCYGIPTDAKRIPALTRKILNSPYVDRSLRFDVEIFLELDQLDDELWEEAPAVVESEIEGLTEKLRSRITSVLAETQRRYGCEGDLSGWSEGYALVMEYMENKRQLIDCISFLLSQKDLYEYCMLAVSLFLAPVFSLLENPEFETVCQDIENRTEGKFSIRGMAELGPYDGINAGSSFYQLYLLLSPLDEFPLRFFREPSEDNRLASQYYHYILSKICTDLDCKLTLLKA